MERRDFLATLAAPVALLPFYPGVEAPADVAIVAPPTVGAVEEPPLFFYVSTEETQGGEELLDEIVTSPTEIEYRRKNCYVGGEGTRYRRVRFVSLNREDRFAVCATAWSAGIPDFRVFDHSKPEHRAAFIAYHEAKKTMAPPSSLLDVPAVIENHSSEWTQDSFPLSRPDAMKKAAYLNERSILNGWIEQRPEWYVVVELGTPISRAFCDIDFDRNGFGVLKRERQWPLRLMRPTAEEMARFPVAAELLAKVRH
jgi:hypothetical protein